jgi:hypothetical protein
VKMPLNCSFVTSPYARVCAGFAGDYLWSGSTLQTSMPLSYPIISFGPVVVCGF